MPFGLKNAGSTYQKMMTRMFDSQLGKNIEVYIDDMVVKSMVVSEQVGDLGSIFEILRGHKLRLNASKCSFGVGSGKVLGYMVTHHGIDVNPDQIKKVDYMGRIAKWGTILGAFDIKYMPRTFVKGQILTDLVAEVYVDGIANQKGLGVRLVLISPEKITIEKFLRLVFSATNNEAEYVALLVGMDTVQKVGRKIIEVFSDSRLVVGQVNDELEVKDLMMQGYLSQVREKAQIHQVRVGPSWMDSIVLFLKDNVLPKGKVEADKAEVANKVIVNGLKKRLDDAKGKWVEKLPHVLWTYWTTPRRSTRETQFSMTYGVKVVIPLETGFPTLRTSLFTPDSNDNLLGKSLDLVEEQRENVMVQLAYYQQKLKQGYDFGVKLRTLAPRDLVLRKVVGTAKNLAWGKLGPNWERSYHITLVASIGAYFLKDLSENIVPCP
ncbi:uncharacterized protein LOC142640831 [Castanea sativa]|uniref:uncharacterized protein LOC142640831 n=1 Tax=Castanea sativa TaxID=21020 RepID=UPI003F6516A8